MAARIIDVERKPHKCPKCGERVVDIIYGTGDMTEYEFLMEYRREGVMGGDNIPRNPPIWACSCGCRRFRKVNPDGTVAPVKLKMLRNVRKAPMTQIVWESDAVAVALMAKETDRIHHYQVHIVTELHEEETFNVTALSRDDAINTVEEIVARGGGVIGHRCVPLIIKNYNPK